MINKEIFSNLKKISNKFDLDLFILFGSRANNTNSDDSDWDFAILPGKNFNKTSYIRLREELYKLTNSEKVDLIDLNAQDNPILRYEVFDSGICINEDKIDLFDENKTNSWYNYLYFKSEIDFRNQQIEESLNKMI